MKKHLKSTAILFTGLLLIHAAPASAETTVIALVASNAMGAFQELTSIYEKKHPDLKFQSSGVGSKIIEAQLNQDSQADIVVMISTVADKSKNLDTPIKVFGNHTVLSVAKTSTIKSYKDLANPGVKLAWGTGNSTGEQIADDTIKNFNLGDDYKTKVKKNIAVTKTSIDQEEKAVENGLADAAIVYASDTYTGKTNVIELADKSYNTEYSVAVVKSSKNKEAVKGLIALMQSSEGMAVLKKHRHDILK